MLKKVVEDYLGSIKEVQFFVPFAQLLRIKGFTDVSIIHGPTEFGKDVLAKKSVGDEVVQYYFQLKAGDVNLGKFRQEIKMQLLEALTNQISHPNYDKSISSRVVFVTTGRLKPPATIDFQEFNQFVVNNLGKEKIEVIEQNGLVEDFVNFGLSPYFTDGLGTNAAGSYFTLYSKLLNETEISSQDLEIYSRRWIVNSSSDEIVIFQTLFEAYQFYTILIEKSKYYEAVLVICALQRALFYSQAKDRYSEAILLLLDEVAEELSQSLLTFYQGNKSISHELTSFSFVAVLDYPRICMRLMEMLALFLIVGVKKSRSMVLDALRDLLNNEKGCERPISDNYAVSLAMTIAALLKNRETELARKLINNSTLWVCDRLEENGLAQIGTSSEAESIQIMSEILDGFDIKPISSSFLASVLLDFSYILGDEKLFENISNELRAVEAIAERFHVYENENAGRFVNVRCSSDSTFSREFSEDYCNSIKHERMNSKIDLNYDVLAYFSVLLRDRYFPLVWQRELNSD